LFVGNDSIYNIRISNDTLFFNNQTFTGGGSTGFKWVVTGGGTDKIYTAVQSASVGDVVIVDAGAYTENNNLIKNGVSIHFMAGAVVTTTKVGALFDVTGVSSDVLITGDGKFLLTNELFDLTNTTTCSNIYIEYSVCENTGANPIFDLTTSNKYTGTLTINGKVRTYSSANRVVSNVWRASNILKIIGGYYGSGAAECFYFMSQSQVYLTIDCNYIYTAHATLYALYAHTLSSGNINIKAMAIQGTKAFYFAQNPSSSKTSLNVNANIEGACDLQVTSNNIESFNANFYGSINGAFGITGTATKHGFINIYSNTHSTITLSSDVVLNIYGRTYGIVLTQSNGVINMYGAMYGDQTTVNTNLGTITGGILNIYGEVVIEGGTYLTRTMTYLLINGGEVYNYGRWYMNNASAFLGGGELVTLQSGKFGNFGYMKNNCASANSYCVEVTGNSTLIHNGGRFILNTSGAGSSSIYNAASTLTIKNYNNYFTNIARSGAGTYTETITDGGTEIVDTDVTE
jgi:hypothetical protein